MPRNATAPARTSRPPASRRPRTRRSAPGEAPRRAAPGAQRRVSGSARPRPAARVAAGGAVALPGRVLRAPFARMACARGTSLLDALLRGRAWIALVGVLLVGIVFFNVDLLRLNREIARTSEQSAVLKRGNGRLLLELARLGSSERIQQAAAERGLVLPAPGDVRYLRARLHSDGRAAARRMIAPDPTAQEPTAPAPTAPAIPTIPAPTAATPAIPTQAPATAEPPATQPTEPQATEPEATAPPTTTPAPEPQAAPGAAGQ